MSRQSFSLLSLRPWGRPRWRRPATALAVGAACAVLLAACGSGASTPGATGTSARAGGSASQVQSGGKLTVELVNVSWASLYPTKDFVQIAGDQLIMNAIYGSLFTLSSAGALEPDLAASYSLSPSETTLTVHLRPGVTFSDGSPFDAQAVYDNWAADLAAGQALGETTGWTAFTKGFKVVDPETIQLLLKEPYAGVLPSLTNEQLAYIASPKALAAEGVTKFGVAPVGAGPFKVTAVIPNQQIKLVKNPGYYKAGEPKLSALELDVVASSSSGLDALSSGQAQLMWANGGIEASTLTQATRNPQLAVENPPATWWDFINFSLKSPVFANQTAREAVWLATDPAAINQALYGGRYHVDTELIGPGEEFYAPKAITSFPKHDTARARQLVTQLGGLRFTLYPEFDSPTWVTLAEALQKQWTAAGMKVSIITSQESAFLQRQDQSNFDVELAQYGGNYDPALTAESFIAYPIVGKVLPDEASLIRDTETDPTNAGRQAAFNRLFNYLAAHAMTMPLFAKSPSYVQATDLSGIPVTYNLTLTTAGFRAGSPRP